MNDIPRINQDRLWSDLMELGKIGFQAGQGVSRVALSAADIQGKRWLTDKMAEAGLQVREDEAFNIIGTLKAASPITSQVAAMGSHLDTVPNGGMFDGALGVLAALECARIVRENNIALPWDLEIINFCDEEGAHNSGTVGSRAMLGRLTEEELANIKNRQGVSFAENLKLAGKDPALIFQAKRDPSEFAIYLELHIEQGKYLESKGLRIGAVTAIAGIYRFLVTVKGEPGHAGTFPMDLRRDALVEAAPLFTLLPQWVMARNPRMVGTIGQISLSPGAPNVVPGLCRFVVELRSQHMSDVEAVRYMLETYAKDREGWQIEPTYEKPPDDLDQGLIEGVMTAARKEGLPAERMASGAGHDAQTFAGRVPTGMIFVPCKNGVSHSPTEWIEKENAAEGCQVLLRSLLQYV